MEKKIEIPNWMLRSSCEMLVDVVLFNPKCNTYILEDRHPIVVPLRDYIEWCLANFPVVVGINIVHHVHISTIFHGICDDNSAEIFETRIFGGPYDKQKETYSTWDAAAKGHDRWVKTMKLSYAHLVMSRHRKTHDC